MAIHTTFNKDNPDGITRDLTPEEEALIVAQTEAHEAGAFDRAITKLRERRTALLTETDFYALSDVTMSEDMTNYRQALRDLPDGLDTVEKVNNKAYPTKP